MPKTQRSVLDLLTGFCSFFLWYRLAIRLLLLAAFAFCSGDTVAHFSIAITITATMCL